MPFNPLVFLMVSFGIAGLAPVAQSFSLLCPFRDQAHGAADPWQGRPYAGRPGGLGYSLTGDIGGPMFLQDAYRWNMPVITYGFDPEFIAYFGQAGVDEVEKAIAILNALPPASEMSATLEEFPLDTRAQNMRADSLGLLDLKSYVLALLLEQMGLAMPERFVWSLRARNASPAGTNHVVLNLNFDPVTLQASPWVNGVLYNYQIFDALGLPGEQWASAVEWYQFDPLFIAYSSVASGVGSPDLQLGSSPDSANIVASPGLWSGEYFTALTRDDVGGLRFLLSRENKRWEALLPDITGTAQDAPNVVDVALRPGVEKLTFQRQHFDPATQQFHPVTNVFSDIYFTNDVAVTQTLQRVVTTPDVLFQAKDIGVDVSHFRNEIFWSPRLYERSDTSGWINHAGLNGRVGEGGPGVIRPPVRITFNKIGRYAYASGFPAHRSPGSIQLNLWGSFDGSENPPSSYLGGETNVDSLVLESRLVEANGVRQLEWSTLCHWDTTYRIEVSTNLVAWTPLFFIVDTDTGSRGVLTLHRPIGESREYFRAIKEESAP